jgi:hypothetical protein
MANLGIVEIVVLMALLAFVCLMVLRFLVTLKSRMRQETGIQTTHDAAEKPKRDFYTLVDDPESDAAEDHDWKMLDGSEGEERK